MYYYKYQMSRTITVLQTTKVQGHLMYFYKCQKIMTFTMLQSTKFKKVMHVYKVQSSRW